LLKAENLPGLPGKQAKAYHLCYYALIWLIATIKRLIRVILMVFDRCVMSGFTVSPKSGWFRGIG
jgi:hypothetical protein